MVCQVGVRYVHLSGLKFRRLTSSFSFRNLLCRGLKVRTKTVKGRPDARRPDKWRDSGLMECPFRHQQIWYSVGYLSVWMTLPLFGRSISFSIAIQQHFKFTLLNALLRDVSQRICHPRVVFSQEKESGVGMYRPRHILWGPSKDFTFPNIDVVIMEGRSWPYCCFEESSQTLYEKHKIVE